MGACQLLLPVAGRGQTSACFPDLEASLTAFEEPSLGERGTDRWEMTRGSEMEVAQDPRVRGDAEEEPDLKGQAAGSQWRRQGRGGNRSTWAETGPHNRLKDSAWKAGPQASSGKI